MLPGLVSEYEGVDGLKNRYNRFCWTILQVQQNARYRLIAVVMKAEGSMEQSYKARFNATRNYLIMDLVNSTVKLVPADYSFKNQKSLK